MIFVQLLLSLSSESNSWSFNKTGQAEFLTAALAILVARSQRLSVAHV
jgi:hypothetical protein